MHVQHIFVMTLAVLPRAISALRSSCTFFDMQTVTTTSNGDYGVVMSCRTVARTGELALKTRSVSIQLHITRKKKPVKG